MTTRGLTQAQRDRLRKRSYPHAIQKPTSPLVEAELDCEPFTKGDTHDVGKDTRGLGLETFDGRGAVRKDGR